MLRATLIQLKYTLKHWKTFPTRHQRQPRHLPAALTEETPGHPLNLTRPPHDRDPLPAEHEPTGATHHTTPRVRAHGERNSRASTPPLASIAQPIVHRPATAQPHRPPTSPNRTCAAAQCPWEDDYDVLPAIEHLLAATARRPHAHQQATEPQEPDHPMQTRSISPSHRGPDRGTPAKRTRPRRHAPGAPPPPEGHLRHTTEH